MEISPEIKERITNLVLEQYSNVKEKFSELDLPFEHFFDFVINKYHIEQKNIDDAEKCSKEFDLKNETFEKIILRALEIEDNECLKILISHEKVSKCENLGNIFTFG